MRIRQVKPGLWKSARLHRGLRADDRQTLIGLAMLADDDGYLIWKPEDIVCQLDPYRSPRRRWREFMESADRLLKAGQLVTLACGHACLPNADIFTDIHPAPTHDCWGIGRRRQPEREIEDRLFQSFLDGPYWLVDRQVRLGQGAIADIVVGATAEDGSRSVFVIEVKAVPAGTPAMRQVQRYCDLARMKWDMPIYGLVMAPKLSRAFEGQTKIGGVALDRVALDG